MFEKRKIRKAIETLEKAGYRRRDIYVFMIFNFKLSYAEMKKKLPDLSRFEMQCLRRISAVGEVTVRQVQAALPERPGYSTVRKIFERLETKGAIRRVRRDGRAWIYTSIVPASAMIRKEVRRLIDSLFDGQAAPLIAQIADMDELSIEDLREIEKQRVVGDSRRSKSSRRERQ